MASSALTLGAVTAASQSPPPSTDSRAKVVYNGETFNVRRTGERIVVQRRKQAFKKNNGLEQRDAMKAVARNFTGCELADEFFTFWQFDLEARLVCDAPPHGDVPDGKAGASS